MVSFQCHGEIINPVRKYLPKFKNLACGDVVKKPKLDQHRGRCHAGFDCIDCHTTFNGPLEYKGHTQCISEAQKYQKSLYKGPKKKVTGANGTPMGGQDRSYTPTLPSQAVVLPDPNPDNGVQNSEVTPAPSGEISTVEKKKKDSKKRKRAPIEGQEVLPVIEEPKKKKNKGDNQVESPGLADVDATAKALKRKRKEEKREKKERKRTQAAEAASSMDQQVTVEEHPPNGKRSNTNGVKAWEEAAPAVDISAKEKKSKKSKNDEKAKSVVDSNPDALPGSKKKHRTKIEQTMDNSTRAQEDGNSLGDEAKPTGKKEGRKREKKEKKEKKEKRKDRQRDGAIVA